MGLDILIITDKRDEIYSDDYYNSDTNFEKLHSLSRTFCNFMCRQNISNGKPELDQIGEITSVDISPIYQMETYGSDNNEELEFYLETADNDEERQTILQKAQQNKDNLKGNIDKVYLTINLLIDKLSSIENLAELLNHFGNDTLNYNVYFTDFNTDKGKGYIDNNFGQDLRNFKRFIEYAKGKGASTVYFNYG
jgi:hypothetical protein